MNPETVHPPFKYATVPDGSTESNLKNNYPMMYHYMKSNNLNRPDALEGLHAVKNGYVGNLTLCLLDLLSIIFETIRHTHNNTSGRWLTV